MFSEQNARAHVGMLAGTIGSRPAGSPANARARAYIIDQLRLFGFEVRLQETDARRAEHGLTARVANIIALRPGSRSEAVGLVSHYDSGPDTPGAADDAFGVAVSLEAARVLAARVDRTWSLMVLMTDAEETGLMGAAALMTDRDVTARLHAYVNVESIGSDGPAVLFENGPGNAWLVDAWARSTPHPHGQSFGIEVYRRLPNDTDFTVIKRQAIPGLNFAVIGDSYPYHTARDTPDRLSTRALRDTGENVVALVTALDDVDITQRSVTLPGPTYFDLAGAAACSYGPGVGWLLGAVALLGGALAWARTTAAAIRMAGIGRWLLTLIWAAVGAAFVIASMVAATWALRAAREVYHPWYARPGRLFLMLLAVAVATGWSVERIGQWLPARAHGLRHPIVTWSLALPVWLVLAALSLWFAPAAAYLWVLPLLTAAVLVGPVPAARIFAVRLASVVVFAVVVVLWLRDSMDLLRFMVAVFGRLPVVTPIWIYAGLMATAGLMLVPPFIAATARSRPLVRPTFMTAVFLIAVSAAAGFAYIAPAYTFEQPLRRHLRVLQEGPAQPATWEVASTEPGLDLAPGAPAGWTLAASAPPGSVPWPRLRHPFVFRTTGPSLGDAPIAIAEASLQPLGQGVELTLTVIPRETALALSLVLPEGIRPARSNLPGIVRQGRWTAAYAAAPPDGVRFRASFARLDASLRDARLTVTSARLPGGDGWQGLPGWIPQERTVWSARATWVVAPFAEPRIAPVPPLR